MSTRLRRSFIWHAMPIAALISQPLAADGKWWEKDPVVESVCITNEIEKRCKAGDILPLLDYRLVPYVCDYRYSIIKREDYGDNHNASCVYLGHKRRPH